MDKRLRRIDSIVSLHALVFDSPILGLELGSGPDYLALLESTADAEPATIKRLSSILNAHGLLFESGTLPRDEGAEREIRNLLQYLATLSQKGAEPPARATVMPKTLGMAFARKGLGFPLFGLYRPAVPPVAQGLLVCYQSPDADGTGSLSVVRVNGSDAIRYAGLGAVVGSTGPWLHVVFVPEGIDWRANAGRRFGRRAPTQFELGSWTAIVAASGITGAFAETVMNPFDYRYAYYFLDDGALRANTGRFLRGLLSGTYSASRGEAESIADLIIERSP
jgi:hypothetical protein